MFQSNHSLCRDFSKLVLVQQKVETFFFHSISTLQIICYSCSNVYVLEVADRCEKGGLQKICLLLLQLKLKSCSSKWDLNGLSGHSFQMLKMTSSQHLYLACLQMFQQLFSESDPLVIHSRKLMLEGNADIYRVLTPVGADSFHRDLPNFCSISVTALSTPGLGEQGGCSNCHNTFGFYFKTA